MSSTPFKPGDENEKIENAEDKEKIRAKPVLTNHPSPSPNNSNDQLKSVKESSNFITNRVFPIIHSIGHDLENRSSNSTLSTADDLQEFECPENYYPYRRPRRGDLQVIRGIAIIAVLGFHLLPQLFPNGYIGVDIFFILLGYRMARMLCKDLILQDATVIKFYKWGFTRIMPLFALMLLFASVATILVFTESDMTNYVSELKWAFGISTNWRMVFEQGDNETQGVDYQVLIHTWSLGIELQYYIIVPFIAFFRSNVLIRVSVWCLRGVRAENFWYWSRPILFAITFIASLTFHLIFSRTVAFAGLHARMWQFATGHIVFEFSQFFEFRHKPKEEQTKRWVISALVTLSFATLVLFPFTIDETTYRIFVTLITGIILLGGAREWIITVMYSFCPLEYISNLSYVLYMVHWPIIVLLKYYKNVAELSAIDALICFAAIIVLSIFIHHTIEYFFLSRAFLYGAITTAVIYVVLILAIIIRNHIISSSSEEVHPRLDLSNKSRIVWAQ